MNIFCLDASPKKAAQYHVDKHVVKMVLESVQLLCTAHRILDGEFFVGKTKTGRNIKRWKLPDHLDQVLYTATHINHPSAVWCRERDSQYMWLAELTRELCREYTYRYGKFHKCQTDGLVDWLLNNRPKNISREGTFTLPSVAMPDYCKAPGDVVTSYRRYYVNEKQRMHSWAGKINSRPTPEWLNDSQYLILKEVV